jgi:glycosyltransferase involved in cell wall biosynthesis
MRSGKSRRVSAGRIIIFVPAIHAFGGVERLVVELSRLLHEEGKAHTILCLSRSIDLTVHADWPMDVQSLDAARNPVAEAWALGRYFRDPDNAGSQAPLLFDLKGAFYAGLFRCPDFHLHLTDPPSLLPLDVSKRAPSIRRRFLASETANGNWRMSLRGEAVHRINRRGVRRARSVITMTNAIADEIEGLYARRATVIRQGVSSAPSGFSAAQTAPGTIRFLSVSRLESNKRIDWVLYALAELERPDRPLSTQADWALDVAGDGSEAASLHALAASLGIAERVKFAGHVGEGRLNALYAQAGIFLMPAVQGYGLPALEALTRGIPVILHRQSGVSEILNQPPWIELISRGREDLAPAIQRMMANIASGALQRAPKPALPTASGWARQIAAMCGWS